MRKKVYVISCAILAALVASGLWATKAVNPTDTDQAIEVTPVGGASNASLRDLALQSDLIITGQCVNTRSAWIENNRILVTLATIAVNEVVKGEGASMVTVVLPGGVDLNREVPVAMTYAGAPQIATQEEVFLFLTGEDAAAGGHSIMGFSQGKFSIVEDEGGQKLISRDFTKVRVQQEPGMVRGTRQFVPLPEFMQKVRGYLGK